jgi:hypothetical protein
MAAMPRRDASALEVEIGGGFADNRMHVAFACFFK